MNPAPSFLLEHYGLWRSVHLSSVVLSLSLFAARGLGVLGGGRWPLSRPVRQASVAIDSVLLAGGVMLWMARALDPLGTDAWLGLKLALVVLYIVLGSVALKRGRTAATRRAAFVAAIACAGLIVGIARAHHPAGWFHGG